MIRRKKKPTQKIKTNKKKIEKIIKNLSSGWNPDERETNILFEHSTKEVHLETSHPPVARRWFEGMWGDPNIKWDYESDTLKIIVPWHYCRPAEFVIKPKHREFID